MEALREGAHLSRLTGTGKTARIWAYLLDHQGQWFSARDLRDLPGVDATNISAYIHEVKALCPSLFRIEQHKFRTLVEVPDERLSLSKFGKPIMHYRLVKVGQAELFDGEPTGHVPVEI